MPSTLIRDIDYDEATTTLSVRLVTTNDRYAYEGVDPRTYQAFRSAFVKGRFLNRFIRGRYKYRIVAADGDAKERVRTRAAQNPRYKLPVRLICSRLSGETCLSGSSAQGRA
jgi:hypothetical protein